MSADNLVYLQRCLDGKWRAWEQSASVDAARPPRGFIVEALDRSAAIVAAHDWTTKNYTEYGLVELDPEAGPPTIRETFDLMADAHMHVFGMKDSPIREAAWAAMKAVLDKAHERA